MKKIVLLSILMLTFAITKVSAKNFSLGGSFQVEFKAGHDASECASHCFFFGAFPSGTWMHMPCWAFGTNCTFTVGVTFGVVSNGQEGDPYTGTITFVNHDFSGDNYNINAQSIYKSDIDMYMNIPTQTMPITGTSYTYTVTNVTFTSSPTFTVN